MDYERKIMACLIINLFIHNSFAFCHKRYMRDENTIILAIQDATQDIGASEALKHALSAGVDPEGKRTIGVLTKLDKLEEGSDTDRAIDILENRTKPLQLGYIGVVNRTQNQVDRNINIESAKQVSLILNLHILNI